MIYRKVKSILEFNGIKTFFEIKFILDQFIENKLNNSNLIEFFVKKIQIS